MGATVAQVYVAPQFTVPGVEVPKEQLAGFQRTNTLAPGQTQQITLHVKLADLSQWDENDLKQVTMLARRMVTLWGMSDEIGLVSLDASADAIPGHDAGRGRWFSERTAEMVDREVRRISQECYSQAVAILTRERARLDRLASALLTRETLNEAEIAEVALGFDEDERAGTGRAAAD